MEQLKMLEISTVEVDVNISIPSVSIIELSLE